MNQLPAAKKVFKKRLSQKTPKNVWPQGLYQDDYLFFHFLLTAKSAAVNSGASTSGLKTSTSKPSEGRFHAYSSLSEFMNNDARISQWPFWNQTFFNLQIMYLLTFFNLNSFFSYLQSGQTEIWKKSSSCIWISDAIANNFTIFILEIILDFDSKLEHWSTENTSCIHFFMFMSIF